MTKTPNYRQDRAERDRRARVKKLEKQQLRDVKSAQRKTEQEADRSEPAEDMPGG